MSKLNNNTNLNNLIKSLQQTLTTKQNNNTTKRRNQRRRRLNRVARRQRRAIPAANGNGFNKRFYVDQLTSTSARVSGSDLVYAIPDNLQSGTATNVITIIPCNPAYWLGTRVSAIATGYQNYRPIKFNVHYVPQVAVTQQGNVIGGTMWFDSPPIANLQQTLRTSNGGIMTQCYKPAMSHVRLQSNLQYNLYRTAGNIDQQSMPFFYIAIAVACKTTTNMQITPGYFYVDYTFLFKNPTGPSTVFTNSGLTFFETQTSSIKPNAIAILCSELVTETASFNVGTILDIEYDSDTDAYIFKYNNTVVESPAGRIWILSNGLNQALNYNQKKASTRIPIYYESKTEPTTTENITIPANTVAMYKEREEDPFYSVILNNSFIPEEFPVGIGKTVYFSEDTGQNFGNLSSITGNVIEFLASTVDYYLQLQMSAKNKKLIKSKIA